LNYIGIAHMMSSNFFLQSLSALLYVPEKEVNGLRKLVATINSVALKTRSQPEARVTFQKDGKTAFVEFLSCFEVGSPLQETSTITLKRNISEDRLKRNSKFVILSSLNTWFESSIRLGSDKDEITGGRDLQLNVGSKPQASRGPDTLYIPKV
jgi:hypothetical protein